jgi:hypothetical protein
MNRFLQEKGLIFLLCVAGIAGVFYGMTRDIDWIFIVGILCIIGGYLMIRKRLKNSRDRGSGDSR